MARPSAASSDRPRYSEGRQALLDATVRVFTAEGIGGLSYRAVAKEARVTHGLVSYHFGSREAMVHAALAQVARQSIEASAIVPDSGELSDFARRLPEYVEHDPDGSAAQFDLAVQSRRHASLKPEVQELYASYIDVCAQALERFDVDADPAMARVVFAALDGLVLQQLIFDDPAQTEAALEALRRLIGLLPRR
jgi:AcrR family transcriptional regulator